MPFITDRLGAAGGAGPTGGAGPKGGAGTGGAGTGGAGTGGAGTGGAGTDNAAGPGEKEFAAAAVGRLDAARIRAQLRARIFGQERALASIFRTLTVVQAGLQDGTRPLVSHLLVGPSGTGKTELVRQLAAALRTGPRTFVRWTWRAWRRNTMPRRSRGRRRAMRARRRD